MIPVAFDTETALIRPGLLAPPLACLTWQMECLDAQIDADHERIVDRFDLWLRNPEILIVGHNVAYDFGVLAAAFPALLPLIFAAYRANRVTDTKIRQQLLDIAGGVYRGRVGEKGRWIKHGYSLEELARRLAGMQLQKDGWRMSYGNFIGLPLDQWPAKAREIQAGAEAQIRTRSEDILARAEEIVWRAHGVATPPPELDVRDIFDDLISKDAEIKHLRSLVDSDPEQCIKYPLDDARATLAVYLAQEKHAEPYLKDQYRQAYAAWALHLSSAWGLRTNGERVKALTVAAQAAYDAVEAELKVEGIVREDGTRDTKAAKARMVQVCREENLPLRRTPAHEGCAAGDACEEHVCLDDDACRATGDHVLIAYAELTTAKKILSNDVEMLCKATVYPCHPRYDIAETGRSTCAGPNIQNLNTGRAKEKGRRNLAAAVRECFEPRPGRVFAGVDYPQLELYTLAQCCMKWVGQSKLAEAINRGLDPHLAVAAQIRGVTYDYAAANKEHPSIDSARQTAKVANFGFPGGLGVAKLCLFAKKTYGVDLTVPQATELKEQWFATWPEMRGYFARVNALMNEESGLGNVVTLFTERHRGAASYCAACNNGFQALGVDCAKRALTLIAEAEYVDTTSPLFGARTVAFVHDEVIAEVDDGPDAHDAALELARLMVEGANAYLPDVPMRFDRMKPVLMRRWSKKAKPVFENGRLVPWDEAA